MENKNALKEKVRVIYSTVAERPLDKHPFPVGRNFAESIGYQADLLNSLPAASVDSFTGVSNVSIFADIAEGTFVLDLGCGAGLDTFIASRRTGPRGKVSGVDFSEAMINKARQSAKEGGYDNVSFYIADAEKMPLQDASVNIALVNGIFNLSPFREKIFQELARVLRTGGSVYAAELILKEPVSTAAVCSIENWFR